MFLNNIFFLIRISRHTDLNNAFLKFFILETKIKIPTIIIYRFKIDLKNYVMPYIFLYDNIDTVYKKNIKKIIIWFFSSIYISPYKSFEIFNMNVILYDDKYFIKPQIDIKKEIFLKENSNLLYSFIKKSKNIMYFFLLMQPVSEVQKPLLILCYKIIKSLHFIENYNIESKLIKILNKFSQFVLNFNNKTHFINRPL